MKGKLDPKYWLRFTETDESEGLYSIRTDGRYRKDLNVVERVLVKVSKGKVEVILEGGPLHPIVLTIKGNNLRVDDWWGWGCG
jgi:hypothetical protein